MSNFAQFFSTFQRRHVKMAEWRLGIKTNIQQYEI